MSQPTTYERAFNFTNQQAVTPSDPIRADKLDLELNLVKTSLDETQSNLALIQRDDGAIANRSVGFDQFKTEVVTGFNPPTPWMTAANYIARDTIFKDAIFYLCAESHISGVFATDLAAGKWSLIADLSSVTTGLPAVPVALEYLRRNASNSAYECRTPAETLVDIGGDFHAATGKTTPVDADELGLWDSVGLALSKLTFANLKATLFKSSLFRLRDSADPTKLLAFVLSGITPAATRTITVPDADITLPIVTPWVPYTPTFVGVGTLADLKCRSRRVGSNLEVQAQWTNGTVTASDFSLTMGFNGVNGTLTCAAFWNTYRPICGTAVWNINDAALYMIASGGSNLVNISISASGRQGLTPVVGTTLGTSTTIGAQFSVPIEGWN